MNVHAMKSFENKIRVLITSTNSEAKGGITILHKVLFGQIIQNKFCPIMFPISSPNPFNERLNSRINRLIGCMKHFYSLLIKDKSLGIVHINSSYDTKAILRDLFFIIVSWWLGRKIILQIHSEIDFNKYPKIIKWIAKHVFPLSNKILVFSKNDMKNIEMLAPKEKIEILPNAIKVDDFASKDKSFKKDLSIPEHGEVILFLSRLIKEKGVYDLIESITTVVKEYKNVYFLIAGEGPERNRMEMICKEKGIEKDVRFTGHIYNKNLLKAFSCADIFVLPTYSEAMPMVILEALAAGLPIISTPIGAIPDIIKDGINGFLIEPNSPKQLAEKILLLLHNEEIKKRIGKANSQLAKEEYDVKVILNKLEQLYLSI
jgi:glycosyltransferase involved in cell wall biosynthesis